MEVLRYRDLRKKYFAYYRRLYTHFCLNKFNQDQDLIIHWEAEDSQRRGLVDKVPPKISVYSNLCSNFYLFSPFE